MTLCPSCGAQNVSQSRFCVKCGAALDAPVAEGTSAAGDAAPRTEVAAPPAAEPKAPSVSVPEQSGPGSLPAAVNDAATQQLKTQPLSPAMTEPADDATLELGATIAGYQVLELREEQPDMRVYRAQAPADLCLQCGTRSTEPNARFCENCGAELLPRDVLLLEPLGDTPARGPWLALNLPADPRQALLPPLTPLEHNGTPLLVVEATIPGWQSLAELLINHGAAPDQPAAVQDDDAFVLARQLADALHYLHSNGVALGELSLAHLLVGPQGRLRLRDLDSLEPLTPESQRADLGRLLATLEEITRQPRTTQKLDGALLEGDGQRSLQDVLGLARAGRLPDVEGWITALDAVQQSQRAVTPLQVHVAGHSDVGRVRELNEDALLTLNLDVDMAGRSINAGLYVVADGMGGHEAGEVASNLAIQSMANDAAPALVELLAESANGVTFEELKLVAARAALHANEAVYAEGRRRGNDMGTTLTFALVVGDRCVVGNVGDSRTYMYRNGELQRVTSDHSLVQRLVDMGQITPDEVYTHPHRNAILRSLGENPNVETDLFELRLQPGDALLLCSDGLWEMVRDDRLEAIMVNDDVHAAVEQVVDEANRNGGEDNIAAVLVQFAADAATGSAAQTHAAKEEHTNV